VLLGRTKEIAVIDQLLTDARAGTSGALLIRGEAGIGKSALMDYAARSAAGMRVLRAAGVESEADIAFGALHLLLHTELGHVDSLPDIQAAALRGALGLAPSVAEDRLLVGLAVLTLLSDLAEQVPVVVIIDDAQWFDQSSMSTLLFAARRLTEEGIAMIFAVRDGEHMIEYEGLPQLQPTRLSEEDALALLVERRTDLLPELRRRVVGESAGNPLALLELSRPYGAGSDPPIGPPPLEADLGGGHVQRAFRQQIDALPEPTRKLLLVAAADDLGDVRLILKAAHSLGVDADAIEPAERVELIIVSNDTVAFRHPLARAAAYHDASFRERLAAHAALAEACDTVELADRQAWHRAASAIEPDEGVATMLEAAADRARVRGAHATEAAALERAADLSIDDQARVRRLCQAAAAARDAGLLKRAASLVERVSKLSGDPLLPARLAPISAAVEFEYGSPALAAAIFIDGGRRLGPHDPAAALSMLSNAMGYVLLCADRNLADQILLTVDVLAPAAADPLRATLTQAMAMVLLDRTDPALRLLHDADVAEWPTGESTRSVLLAAHAALTLGDDQVMYALTSGHVATCRRRGLIGQLPEALLLLAIAELFMGRHRHAIANAEEGMRLVRDTGQVRQLGFQAAILAPIAAIQGEEDRCRALCEETIADATERGLTVAAAWSWYALGQLDLGLGRYDDAYERMGEIQHRVPALTFSYLADQIEAAFRSGRSDRLEISWAQFGVWARHARQPWARGVVERSRALASPDAAAESHYQRATALHAEGGRPFQRARTQLLYGEWLRRGRRPTDARRQLRMAAETFDRLGAIPWTDRANQELRAAGEDVPSAGHRADPLSQLTAQELQVVRLAATGATNREIAGQLFLSPRTVGYHLYKAYPKLGVSSRRALASAPWLRD
jgi:DNA-binding CsgD family transcriptional regulator